MDIHVRFQNPDWVFISDEEKELEDSLLEEVECAEWMEDLDVLEMSDMEEENSEWADDRDEEEYLTLSGGTLRPLHFH